MGIKETDGQLLHLFKHLVSDGFERALRYRHHQAVIKERGQRTDEVDHRQHDERPDQTGEHRLVHAQQRDDVAVNQRLQEHGGNCTRNGAEQDADRDHDHGAAVGLHIGQQPL